MGGKKEENPGKYYHLCGLLPPCSGKSKSCKSEGPGSKNFFNFERERCIPILHAMSSESSDVISFHFEKTHSFQTLHADGVFQSLTPDGNAFLAFFVERTPIPQRVDFKVGEDGSLGEVIQVETKEGIFREVHTGITMTREGLLDLKERIEDVLETMKGEDAK